MISTESSTPGCAAGTLRPSSLKLGSHPSGCGPSFPEDRCCPSCGQPLPDAGIFDDAAHEIITPNGRRRLSPMRWKILAILRSHAGSFVSHDRLHSALYDSAGEARDDSTLRTHVHYLRTALKGTGYRVAARYTIGYRLEKVA